MAVVWEKGEATVQEVKNSLEPGRSPAYTTVMTVMSRLAEKGILERHKEGRAYVYSPATAQEKLAGSMLRALIGRLYGGSSAHAIAHLIESDEGVDDAELARLEKLIRQKRRRS
ncbi:MAG: BlaI/MecI/CopY family transcriptional regulator [Acidobacteria bacterium]|nr:BlaI/MecI/CopY family transcriptional regulator [Acidobacteriota bacterium]